MTTPTTATPTETKPSDYGAEFNAVLAELSMALEMFSHLMTLAGRNTALMGQDAWRVRLVGEVNTIKGIWSQVRQLKPDRARNHLHGQLLKVTDEYNRAMTRLIDALDTSSPSALNEAVATVQRASVTMTALRTAVKEFNANKHG